MRPLFAYLRALTLPTSVYAAPEDWGAAQGTTAPTGRDTGLSVDVVTQSISVPPGGHAGLGRQELVQADLAGLPPALAAMRTSVVALMRWPVGVVVVG